ncbi:MAG: hypothetical protein MZV65_48865 [Chromatiales bacterium]|nr:hypothetical protein [Chromatiales bacterium]
MRFNDLFELTEEEKQKIHGDDEQMMLFGFRFLRQVLFGEDSIPLRKESAEQRRDAREGAPAPARARSRRAADARRRRHVRRLRLTHDGGKAPRPPTRPNS